MWIPCQHTRQDGWASRKLSELPRVPQQGAQAPHRHEAVGWGQPSGRLPLAP